MTKENKEQLIKRLKSFAWRAGIMLATASVAFLSENLGLLELSPEVTVFTGLILAEITKYLNKNAT